MRRRRRGLLLPPPYEIFDSFRGFGCLGDAAALLGLFAIPLLPVGRPVRARNLHGRDLELRTIGRPIGEISGDDIDLRGRMMEGRVDDARRDTIGDERPQGRLPGAACNFHPIAIIDAALLGVMRMDFETVLFVPDDIRGAARLGSDIIMAEDAPGREQQRITRPGFSRRSAHIR